MHLPNSGSDRQGRKTPSTWNWHFGRCSQTLAQPDLWHKFLDLLTSPDSECTWRRQRLFPQRWLDSMRFSCVEEVKPNLSHVVKRCANGEMFLKIGVFSYETLSKYYTIDPLEKTIFARLSLLINFSFESQQSFGALGSLSMFARSQTTCNATDLLTFEK